jgi:hypothetical protein
VLIKSGRSTWLLSIKKITKYTMKHSSYFEKQSKHAYLWLAVAATIAISAAVAVGVAVAAAVGN